MHHVMCLFTPQLLLVLTAPAHGGQHLCIWMFNDNVYIFQALTYTAYQGF